MEIVRGLIDDYLHTRRPLAHRDITKGNKTYILRFVLARPSDGESHAVYAEIQRPNRPRVHSILRLAISSDLAAALELDGLMPPHRSLALALNLFSRHIESHLDDLCRTQPVEPGEPAFPSITLDLQDFEAARAALETEGA